MLTDVETAQACAEYCASSKEGLLWTFNNPRFYLGWTNCQVFSSISGREGNSGGCGISALAITTLANDRRPVRFSAQSEADQVALASAVSLEAENVGFSTWAGASLSV